MKKWVLNKVNPRLANHLSLKPLAHKIFGNPYILLAFIITILQMFNISCKPKNLDEFKKTELHKFGGNWKATFYTQIEQKPECKPYKFFKYYTGKKVPGLKMQTYFGGSMSAGLKRDPKNASRWGWERTGWGSLGWGLKIELTLEMDVVEEATKMVRRTYKTTLENFYLKDVKNKTLVLKKAGRKYRFRYKFKGDKLTLYSLNSPNCPSNTKIYLEKR